MKSYNLPFYGKRYRAWSRFIHRFNYHYMPLSYPDGDTIAWCHWCGLRDKVYDPKAAEARLRAAVSDEHKASKKASSGKDIKK